MKSLDEFTSSSISHGIHVFHCPVSNGIINDIEMVFHFLVGLGQMRYKDGIFNSLILFSVCENCRMSWE